MQKTKHLLLIFLLISCALTATDSLRIQYIGNMGVLIAGQSDAVLIDGLHKPYKPAYLHPPEKLVQEMIANKAHPPIGILLNTHIHQDHFDAGLVHQFLRENPNAQLIGPPQTAEGIASLGGVERLGAKIKVVPIKDNKITTFNCGEVQVDGFYLRHANPARHGAIKNIGYLITMDGLKILHAGDTDWNGEVFKSLALNKRDIDVAILPNWMVMTKEGAAIVSTHLKPRQIIVTHISPFSEAEVKEAVAQYFPQAILFTEIGMEVILESNKIKK